MNIRDEYTQKYGTDIPMALATNTENGFDDAAFFAEWQKLADDGTITQDAAASAFPGFGDQVNLEQALEEIHEAIYKELEKTIFEGMTKAEAETMVAVLCRTGARIKLVETHYMDYCGYSIRDVWNRYHPDNEILM